MLAFSAQGQTQGPHDRPLDASNAWPSGTYGVDYNVPDAQGMRHGPWVRVYEDGALYYAGSFEHGVPNGSWWYFREDGTAISHIVHDPSSLESQAAIYGPEGRLMAMGSYEHPRVNIKAADTPSQDDVAPQKQGAWTYFSADGMVQALVHFDRDVKHGIEEHYLPNGKTCEQGSYHQGLEDGVWRTWFDNGQLRQLRTYDRGVLDGPFEAFYSHGPRLSEGSYLDGLEHGSWKFYRRDGQLGHIQRFSAGQKLETIHINGTFTELHREGVPASERTYRDKKLDGPFREWHDVGEFVIESVRDPETGESYQHRVMKGTALSREGEYVQGLLDGPVYHYDLDETLIKVEHYDMGKLVNTELR
jgi:antitoxin component YwqK of YwqJK toxin-antitoxin module